MVLFSLPPTSRMLGADVWFHPRAARSRHRQQHALYRFFAEEKRLAFAFVHQSKPSQAARAPRARSGTCCASLHALGCGALRKAFNEHELVGLGKAEGAPHRVAIECLLGPSHRGAESPRCSGSWRRGASASSYRAARRPGDRCNPREAAPTGAARRHRKAGDAGKLRRHDRADIRGGKRTEKVGRMSWR